MTSRANHDSRIVRHLVLRYDQNDRIDSGPIKLNLMEIQSNIEVASLKVSLIEVEFLAPWKRRSN